MTPTSRESVINLLNVKENPENKANTTNEGENVYDLQPNLPVETLYHAVYIPLEYKDQSDEEGN